jgi:hypothetical protein
MIPLPDVGVAAPPLFDAKAAMTPSPKSAVESGTVADCVPVAETPLSYHPVVLRDDPARLVNPLRVFQVSPTLKVWQMATIRSVAVVVADVVPVGQLVVDVAATFAAVWSTNEAFHVEVV